MLQERSHWPKLWIRRVLITSFVSGHVWSKVRSFSIFI